MLDLTKIVSLRFRRRGARLGAAVALTLTIGAAAACGGGGSSGDASAHDYLVPDISFGDVPAECAHGKPNKKGVGAPCTEGGGECAQYGDSICTCDPFAGIKLPAGVPCICTVPILGMTCDQIPGDYCGAEATCCSYSDLGSACFPNACLDMAMCPMFDPAMSEM